MALGIIRRSRSKDFVVFSDYLSSLQETDSRKTENSLIIKNTESPVLDLPTPEGRKAELN